MKFNLRKKSSEGHPNNRNRFIAGFGGVALVGVLGAAGGFIAGNQYGHADGLEDCGEAFGPGTIKPVGNAHPLKVDDVAAMKVLAKSDTKPVSFHTSSEDLKAIGLEPILRDLDKGRIISVTIPQEVTVSADSKAAIADALVVGNILKNWADDSDTMVKLTPEGTQQDVEPGTEVLVQLQNYEC
jgi:hypothetical protein